MPVMQISSESGEESPSESSEGTSTVKLKPFRRAARASFADEIQEYFNELAGGGLDNDTIAPRETWQKVVEQKTPITLSAVMLPDTKKGIYLNILPRFLRGKVSPSIFFWFCLIGLLVVLFGSTFGVVSIFAHDEQGSGISVNSPALQVFPATIAQGGLLTLRGAHFGGGEKIKLSYDQQFPLLDTGEVSSIQADAYGSFSDTIIIDPSWRAGMHTLYATDMHTRQQVKTSIMVTGQSALQGPPHLLLSASALDLGAGDETANGSTLLALSNGGGGQVDWQASVSQPWLQISPKSGSIASGHAMSAIVAAERANLAPGSYTANIVFVSNTEQIALSVSMQVMPLQLNHQAILRLSPAALTFTSSAGGPNPQSQVITVSNAGNLPLTWGTSISLQNGSGWLSVVPSNDNVNPGGYETLTVQVNTRNLSPGVYKGQILFSNGDNQAAGESPQSVYVSLTVTPPCTLAFTPNNLNFTGTAGQSAPVSQKVTLSTTGNCPNTLNWTSTFSVNTPSGGTWLSGPSSGTLTPPATAAMNVQASLMGLMNPNTYAGTITISAVDSVTNQFAGTVQIAITLTVLSPPCKLQAASPSTLTFSANVGSNPTSQEVRISATGNCAGNVTINASVDSGSTSWLAISPTPISISSGGTATFTVTVTSSSLAAQSYTGTITLSAADSNGAIAGSPQSVSVSLTVH